MYSLLAQCPVEKEPSLEEEAEIVEEEEDAAALVHGDESEAPVVPEEDEELPQAEELLTVRMKRSEHAHLHQFACILRYNSASIRTYLPETRIRRPEIRHRNSISSVSTRSGCSMSQMG